jgi:uncharacterized repeat protein (TIGR03803 family)
MGALVQATNGDFYGTTSGGQYTNIGGCTVTEEAGCGTVFKITPEGALTTLYSFCQEGGCADGSEPDAALLQASNGNLYGTTGQGGSEDLGTVFEISSGRVLTTLYSFCSANENCTDGTGPNGLIQTTNGKLYGTTVGGGIHNGGTIFSLDVNDGRSSR